MRLKLHDSKKFFNEILEEYDISLNDLSKKYKLNYSNLKQYRRGEKTIPSKIFDDLLKISPRRNYWKDKFIVLQDNWGSVKGGLNAARKDFTNSRLTKARKCRKDQEIIIRINEKFCEFYGALLGDGCISIFRDYENKERYVIQITGNLKLDKDYCVYLKNLLFEEYGIYVYYYERLNDNCCVISVKNKGFCKSLHELFNFPIGVKYDKIQIPLQILNASWEIKKYFLRGLFDTDGCIYANKREKYRYPVIAISSRNKSFLEDLSNILKNRGYPAYTSDKDVCVRGIKNVKRWFSDIGSSNSRNIKKYEYFLKHRFLPARLLNGPVG